MSKSKKKKSAKAKKEEEMMFLPGFDMQSVLASAEDLIAKGEEEQASALLMQAVKAAPKNTQLMDAAGQLLIDIGDIPHAAQVLKRSAELSPGSDGLKWMLLGQIHEAEDRYDKRCVKYISLKYFQRGVEIMVARRKQLQESKDDNKEEESALPLQISNGYCSMAELYTTDLW